LLRGSAFIQVKLRPQSQRRSPSNKRICTLLPAPMPGAKHLSDGAQNEHRCGAAPSTPVSSNSAGCLGNESTPEQSCGTALALTRRLTRRVQAPLGSTTSPSTPPVRGPLSPSLSLSLSLSLACARTPARPPPTNESPPRAPCGVVLPNQERLVIQVSPNQERLVLQVLPNQERLGLLRGAALSPLSPLWLDLCQWSFGPSGLR